MRPTASGPLLRWGALASLSGALVAVVGIFLDWATLTSAGTLVAPVETTTGVAGINHWTGLVALAAGGMAFLGGVGAGFFEDSSGRRSAALVAVGAAVVGLAALAVALSQREAIATTGMPGGTDALEFARDFVREFNEELNLGLPAPRVATGTGLYVTGAGYLLALAGGAVALWQEGQQRRGLHFGR
jgi:hypothetical protein